jgi:hypothetical protein
MTFSQRFGFLFTSDSTSSAFTAQDYTVTTPSGSGVIIRGTGPAPITNDLLLIIPYAKGANNDTFGMRFYGMQDETTNRDWVPVLLAHVVCTITTARTGISGNTCSELHYFCDGFSVTFPSTGANEPSTVKILSPGSDIIGGFYFDTLGFVRIKCDVDLLGTTSHVNAFYRGF